VERVKKTSRTLGKALNFMIHLRGVMTYSSTTIPPTTRPAAEWRGVVAKYQEPAVNRSLMQVATTMLPLAALLFLMYQSLALPYWVTLLLAFPAGGLLVRTFIIMHDCAHGSFSPWRRVNEVVGFITGALTMTAFGQWRRSHALHHASSGDLARRGNGDVDTLTVREYQALSRWKQFQYRLVRHPAILFGIGPLHFIITNRIPPKGVDKTDRQSSSVWATNLAIAGAIVAFGLWIGWKALFLVYFPPMYIAAATGIWLFYVQHQFEDTYWKDHSEWDYATAAIRGSSYFKLPVVLQWFTGNIGLHHVHHLGPRIPNYNLQRAHDENAMFHDVTVLTIRQSMKTLRLRLWDEERGRLVGFNEAR
jgi:omega-6 fatty acid desaturase (delta-12 desaturase)